MENFVVDWTYHCDGLKRMVILFKSKPGTTSRIKVESLTQPVLVRIS
jgi:hypothetical protein